MSQKLYVACSKNVVDFKFDLFVKTEQFPLRTVDCRYSWTRTDVDLDYRADDFLEIYNNYDCENDTDGNKKINCFSSSICYTKMRANLAFERFC